MQDTWLVMVQNNHRVRTMASGSARDKRVVISHPVVPNCPRAVDACASALALSVMHASGFIFYFHEPFFSNSSRS